MARSPARAQKIMINLLKNMPAIMPKRAVISFLADPAVCIPGATAMMETRLAITMARIVYQAYSLMVTEPNNSNIQSGTDA